MKMRYAMTSGLLLLLIVGGYLGYHLSTVSKPTKAVEHVKKTQPKQPKDGLLKFNAATAATKTVEGYIYRHNDDYVVINAERGFLKDAQATQFYIKLGIPQAFNLYFVEPNTLALAQNQVKNQHKTFKLAYGTVAYEELPENDQLGILGGTASWETIDDWPKIKLNQIQYHVITEK